MNPWQMIDREADPLIEPHTESTESTEKNLDHSVDSV
jgi:hypothetical protein